MSVQVAVGLGPVGWAVGLGCAIAGSLLLTGAARRAAHPWGPADRVTAVRAGLACALAALAVGPTGRPHESAALLALAVPALALDGVDGWLARRTATASRFGASFDMETDAFLILVLSVAAARSFGWWVLAIGLARYALLVATRLRPWLRGEVPPRFWAKTVAVIQGVVLTSAAAHVLNGTLARGALVVALALLAESFAHQIRTLWRRRPHRRPAGRLRRGFAKVAPTAAFAVVWVSLVAPDRFEDATPAVALRVPVELFAITLIAIALPRTWARRLLTIAGTALGVLLVLHVVDGGFYLVMDRPFDPVGDWAFFGPGVGVLGDSVGRTAARAAAVGAVLAVVVVVALVPAAMLRYGEAARRRPRVALALVTTLGLLGAGGSLFGLRGPGGHRLVTTQASVFAYDEVKQVAHDVRDRQVFSEQIAADDYADRTGDQLLTALRGKDVLVVFVESYGRVAVQGTSYSPAIDRILDAGTTQLAADGYRTQSAFLTSPTFGAASWLAHSTFQSGVWVDSQRRYDQLLGSDRLTLSGAFGRAGWRTVFDVPAITEPWPEGLRFYGFDQLYDAGDVGYRGPKFGYASMPDQFTLLRFRQLELDPTDRAPVMAEIDLVSSHHPWAPLPHLIPWDAVGDGSVFDPMPALGEDSEAVLADTTRVRDAYGRSIQYTMRTLISFLSTFRDPNLVLIVLGDHQPHGYVTGSSPGHDVPVTVIWSDPHLDDGFGSWEWQNGLRPEPAAPVWRMDQFRDRFLRTFSPTALTLTSGGG